MSYDVSIRVLDMPDGDQRLGRHVEHDERSRSFAFEAPAKPKIQSVRHERKIGILDQGQLGSCTGNAITGLLGTQPFYDTLPATVQKSLDEQEAVTLYSAATKLDNVNGEYPPTDTGSSGIAVAKAAQNAKLISGYQHTFSYDAFLAALMQQPVIVGTNWYQSMFDPDKNGVVSIAVGSKLAGGHEFEAVGYDADADQIIFANSWGTSWGQDGFFKMDSATFKRLLSEQGDATVPVPIDKAPPQPTPSTHVSDKQLAAAVDKFAAAYDEMKTLFESWRSSHA
jgi:hypothetical protein